MRHSGEGAGSGARRQRARARGRRVEIDRLTPRLLFAGVTIDGSTLTITGTANDDAIIVALHRRFINVLTVFASENAPAHYSLASVNKIVIDSGDGNDKVWIDSGLDPLAYAAAITAGAGDDMVTSGAGRDTIDTGDGDDKVYGNGGDDSITTGAGRDSIWAGAGNDTILSGIGNDRVSGEGGNDSITSDKGNDFVDAGDGHDTVSDSGGVDTFDLGAGNDNLMSTGAGTVFGGHGNDTITSTMVVYGGNGNDALTGAWVDGGRGNDTITGLQGSDTLHGGEGEDLIRGEHGNDWLFGDAGNDAVFGGAGTDTLYGGEGNDNLYGTGGYLDTRKDLGGRDDGFGQGGSDWFETGYWWDETDRDGATDQPEGTQNYLPHDTSNGQYIGGTFYSGASGSFDYAAGITSIGVATGGVFRINTGTTTVAQPASPTITTLSLGPGGWLSSGAYNETTQEFVPPPMPRSQRLDAARVILEIPAGWHLGEIATARDEIVWYQVYVDGATPPPAATAIGTLTVNGGTLNVVNASAIQLGAMINVTQPATLTISGASLPLDVGQYTWNGSGFVPSATTEPRYTVPTLAGGTAQVVQSTPHLYDGVDGGKYRYLGVKRGTILVGRDHLAGTSTKWTSLATPILAVPDNTPVRIAGYDALFHTPTSYDTLPPRGPRLRGLAVEGGAIWLPADGAEPYFSSGLK